MVVIITNATFFTCIGLGDSKLSVEDSEFNSVVDLDVVGLDSLLMKYFQ